MCLHSYMYTYKWHFECIGVFQLFHMSSMPYCFYVNDFKMVVLILKASRPLVGFR
jgi:hypothetical protein